MLIMDVNNEIAAINFKLSQEQMGLLQFRTEIQNKNVILVLGNTKSGKSTLINFLIGTDLDVIEEDRLFKIKKRDVNANGPKIGQGAVSCTGKPTVYQLQDNNFIVDTPGFDNNRSVSQDIVNTLYINQLKHAKSARFVWVSDIASILMDNIKGFTDPLEKINKLFGDYNNWTEFISVVFCKDHLQHEQSDLSKLLKNKIIDVEGMDVNKTLIDYFVAHRDLIGSFRMPTHTGRLTQEVNYKILTSMSKTKPLNLSAYNFKVNYSDRSHWVLLKLYGMYLADNLQNELSQIIASFNEYFVIDKYVFASADYELMNTETSLNRIGNSLRSGLELRSLGAIKSFFERLNINVSDIFQCLVNIDNADLMDPREKTKFILQFKEKLLTLIRKINELKTKINDETRDRQEQRNQASQARVEGVVAAGLGLGTMLYNALYGFGTLGIVGAVGAVVGTAVAGTTLYVEHSRNSERLGFRRRQNRYVTANMFED